MHMTQVAQLRSCQSVERPSMYRRLRSRLYDTKDARGKMSRVC